MENTSKVSAMFNLKSKTSGEYSTWNTEDNGDQAKARIWLKAGRAFFRGQLVVANKGTKGLIFLN